MITIRPYQPSDAPALWQLFYQTVREVNRQDYTDKQVEAWAPDGFEPAVWQKKMDALQPFVAELDDVIVGYTDLQDCGLIDHFFCHHQYQGIGIGKALMNHVFEQAEIRGIERLYSEVSLTAKPFYLRLGFSVVREQIIEVRGQRLTNFVMEKRGCSEVKG
ncbi:GNAT family N-acetyltransferase [Vibrio paucivorans]|uniref:GNAT family N-acetyltransferase n=1 Tax=Vibrio paucivorans TaxID=2829489 RepID=A0A9X3CCX7_9VIBR|nr:GNAT family N-acetyltransferase [Vibrio paucivorans]MCW8333443.1 GNAT family N-acetyltransferase [Vibrio paucivorans]